MTIALGVKQIVQGIPHLSKWNNENRQPSFIYHIAAFEKGEGRQWCSASN